MRCEVCEVSAKMSRTIQLSPGQAWPLTTSALALRKLEHSILNEWVVQVSWQRILHSTHFVFRSSVTQNTPMCSGGSACIVPGQMCGQLPPLCTLHNQCALGKIFTFDNVRGRISPEDFAFGREEGGSIRFQTKCVIRIKNMGLSVFQAKRDIIGILLG